MKWTAKYSKIVEDVIESNNYSDAVALATEKCDSFMLEDIIPDIDDVQKTFIADPEKMRDFKKLTKEEFLLSYSYLSSDEYDMTTAYLDWLEMSNTKIDKIKVYGYVAVNTDGWYWGNAIDNKTSGISSEGFAKIYKTKEECIERAYESYQLHWLEDVGGACEMDCNDSTMETLEEFKKSLLNGEASVIQLHDHHIEYCMFETEVSL